MSDEVTVNAETAAEVPAVVAETPKVPEIKVAAKVSPLAMAMAISAVTGIPVRESKSSAYRCLVPGEDQAASWKKGLFFQTSRNAKGINLEMKCYSAKGGAHLAEFNDTFKAFKNKDSAGQPIQVLPLGHAVMLRVTLKDEDGIEKMAEQAKVFIDLVLPTVTEVQAKVTVPESKKPGKPTKVKAAAAEGTPAAKKGKVKTKKAAPAAIAPAAAAVDPSVDAAVAELTAG